MALQDIARSIVNRTGEFGGNVQELAKNILDKQRQRQEFFNQNPEAQKAVNRMKPPMQRAVEFIGKTYLYNPEEKKLFPSSPVHTIQDMRNIQQQRQSGELSEQEARKQLSDKALNMAMVVGELSPSPKAVNNQAARALKMLEEQAKQYDSFDDFVKSQGEPVYHGGSNIKNYEKELKILSPEEKLKYPSRGGGYIGFSTSKNPNVARNYSLASGTDEIAEFRLKPNAKILKVDTGGDGIDEYFTGKQLEELKKQGYDAVEDISKGIEDEVRILSEKAVYTKDQLKNIYNKATQPQLSDDLIKEAQKYKSAEEFVNKYQIEESFDMTPGVTRISDTSETGLYHGAGVTNLKSILNDEKLITNVSKLDSLGEKVISSSGNRSVANSYGVVFELDENIPKRIAPKEAIKGDVYDAFEYRIDSDVPFNKIKSVTIPLDKVDGVNTKIMWDYSGKNPEYISAKELADKFREKGIKVFFDDGTSFSKSQLTDIWNKAMSKVKGK